MKETYASPYIVKTSESIEDLAILAEDVIKYGLHNKPKDSRLLLEMERLLAGVFTAKLKTSFKHVMSVRALTRLKQYKWIRNKVVHKRPSQILSVVYSPYSGKAVGVLFVRCFITQFYVSKQYRNAGLARLLLHATSRHHDLSGSLINHITTSTGKKIMRALNIPLTYSEMAKKSFDGWPIIPNGHFDIDRQP